MFPCDSEAEAEFWLIATTRRHASMYGNLHGLFCSRRSLARCCSDFAAPDYNKGASVLQRHGGRRVNVGRDFATKQETNDTETDVNPSHAPS